MIYKPTFKEISQLRYQTCESLMTCKQALICTDGNMKAAYDILKAKIELKVFFKYVNGEIIKVDYVEYEIYQKIRKELFNNHCYGNGYMLYTIQYAQKI